MDDEEPKDITIDCDNEFLNAVPSAQYYIPHLYESGYFYTRFLHRFSRFSLIFTVKLTLFSPFISVSGNPPVRTSQYTDYFAYVTRVVLTADG
jgi:hypothetical protein